MFVQRWCLHVSPLGPWSLFWELFWALFISMRRNNAQNKARNNTFTTKLETSGEVIYWILQSLILIHGLIHIKIFRCYFWIWQFLDKQSLKLKLTFIIIFAKNWTHWIRYRISSLKGICHFCISKSLHSLENSRNVIQEINKVSPQCQTLRL